jgi:hypothetical protein
MRKASRLEAATGTGIVRPNRNDNKKRRRRGLPPTVMRVGD